MTTSNFRQGNKNTKKLWVWFCKSLVIVSLSNDPLDHVLPVLCPSLTSFFCFLTLNSLGLTSCLCHHSVWEDSVASIIECLPNRNEDSSWPESQCLTQKGGLFRASGSTHEVWCYSRSWDIENHYKKNETLQTQTHCSCLGGTNAFPSRERPRPRPIPSLLMGISRRSMLGGGQICCSAVATRTASTSCSLPGARPHLGTTVWAASLGSLAVPSWHHHTQWLPWAWLL